MQINAVLKISHQAFRVPTKCLLIMKLCAFFMLAGLLQVHAAVFSQQVDLDQKNIEFVDLMQQIEQQTGYHFLYDQQEIQHIPAKDVALKNTALDAALTEILSGTSIDYSIVHNTIVLRAHELDEAGTEQEDDIIQGQVHDAQGQALPGVTIRVKGQNRSTTSDIDGKFTLRISGDYPLLEFSYLGYKTQEVQSSRNAMQVQLELDPGNLDEVVIVGYGTTTQKLNTGSVGSVTSAVLERQPVVDPLAALQGRIPGLVITSNSGMPGGSFNVRVRGEGSLQAGNEPLFIVDGMPFNSAPLNQFKGASGGQNPLNSLNPADIERIDVLKDADATSIYGSRGANGVILITTKKGKSGRSAVNLNLSTGWSEVAQKLEMLSTEEYLELRKEAFANDGETPNPGGNGIDLLDWDQSESRNWQDYLIGHAAPMSVAQLSFTGGSDQTRFILSGNYTRQGNVLPDDLVYQRGAAHLNVNHQTLDGKFQVSASLNYASDKDHSIVSDLAQFYNLPPNMPVYADNGGLYWYGLSQNPMAYLERGSQSNTNSLIANVNINYQILKDFSFQTNLGYSEMHMKQVQTLPEPAFNPSNYPGSSGQYGFSDMQSFIVEPQLNYSLQRGKNHFTFLLGATVQQTLNEGHHLYGTSYTSDSQLENMMNAGSITIRGFNYADYRYASVFGRVKYNFDDRYLINATFRRDGSSRFGPGKRYGNFGSLGLAWIFSNEDWLKENGVLSFGKLRGSYGSTGNDQIGDYRYLDTWASGFPFQGLSGLYPSRVFNPDFGWEDNRKMELALELGFLQDRLFLNSAYYNNRSGNQLVEIALSAQSGFSSYLGNSAASVENSGWEFDLTAAIVQGRNFSWSSGLNVSLPKNKLRAYPDLENTADAAKYVIGESIRIVKGYDFLGIDPQTGLGQYRDIDGDGELYEPEDFVILGDLLPKFFGGFNNDLTYKDLSVSLFFQFVKQDGPNIHYGPYASPYGADLVNQDRSALDRWRQPGDQTNIPRATASSSNEAYSNFRDYYRYSSAVWGDASFIRLKNVSVSYDLSKWVKPYKIQSLRVFAQGQNLLTFTAYRGLDPEIQGFDRSVVSEANPFGTVRPPAMPAMRTYTFGVQIGL